MNQEHVQEWSRLMDEALAVVRRGARIRERGTRREFQLVVIPAFDVVASWELLRGSSTARGDFFDVALVTWDQPADASKFETPVERVKHGHKVAPTIRTNRVSADGVRAVEMVAALERVQVPLLPGQHPIGTDGTLYALSVGDAFGGCTFEWWASGPPRWSSLTAPALSLQTMLSEIAPVASSAAS